MRLGGNFLEYILENHKSISNFLLNRKQFVAISQLTFNLSIHVGMDALMDIFNILYGDLRFQKAFCHCILVDLT